MKKFLIVLLCIALIVGVIFCVNSCRKDDTPESNPENPEGIVEMTPVDDPNTENDDTIEDEKKNENSVTDDSPVYTGTGIYHGRVDSSFIEVTVDSVQPVLTSCRLAPELAEKFSSLNLEPESIITFEYQIIDEQYVISKIN